MWTPSAMDERERPPSSLDDLEARLRTARDRERAPEGRGPAGARGGGSGMAIAARITVELVAGVMVGVGIGYALDQWLGSGPWLMVLFLFLGGAAGVMNAYRAARGLDDSVGLGAAQRRRDEEDRPEGS